MLIAICTNIILALISVELTMIYIRMGELANTFQDANARMK